jgi:circadian clock protein KaiB
VEDAAPAKNCRGAGGGIAAGEDVMAKKPALSRSARAFERSLAKVPQERYLLRLYISGMTPSATRAITNLKKLCEEHLAGRYDLEIIDIYQQPVLAKGEQILAAPTLIKQLPSPLRRIIGDMSNKDRVLLGLDLRSRGETGAG